MINFVFFDDQIVRDEFTGYREIVFFLKSLIFTTLID